MDITEIIGLGAGVCTAASSLPQVIKTVQKRKAGDISPLMFIALLAGNGLWIWYGLKRSDIPVTVTNCFSLLLDIVMLYLHFKFRK